jgi:hypothetical protein
MQQSNYKGESSNNKVSNHIDYNTKIIQCFNCKKLGHHIKDHRFLKLDEKNNNYNNYKCQSNFIQNDNGSQNHKLYVASLINFTNKTSIFDDKWYVDTGATQHMSYDKKAFINYEKWPNGPLVYLGDSTTHAIEGQGDVAIKLLNNKVKEIPSILHILGLTKNLFSMTQFDKAGGELNIKKGICTLKNSASQILTTCSLDNDLYKLGCTNKSNTKIEALPAIV